MATVTEDDIAPAAATPQTISESDITQSPSPETLGDQAHDAAAHLWGAVTGPFRMIAHPIDTVTGMLRDTADEIEQGKQAWDSGNKMDALDHFKNAVPVVGPFIRQLNDEWVNGQYGAMAGDILGAYALGKAGENVGKLPGAAAGAAKAIGSTLANPPKVPGVVADAAGIVHPSVGYALKTYNRGVDLLNRVKQAAAAAKTPSGAAAEPPLAGAAAVPRGTPVNDPDTLAPYRNTRTMTPSGNQATMGSLDRYFQQGLAENPAVAGDTRTLPDGTVQVLKDVPLDEINPESSMQRGNVLDMDKVRSLQESYKNGDPVPPVELRPDPDGQAKYGIFEGNHRLFAQASNGASAVKAWTPVEGLQINAPETAPPAEDYRNAAQADKAVKVGKFLADHGFDPKEVADGLSQMTAAQQDQFWKNAADGASAYHGEKINAPNSAKSRAETMFHLNRLSGQPQTIMLQPSAELSRRLQESGALAPAGALAASLAGR